MKASVLKGRSPIVGVPSHAAATYIAVVVLTALGLAVLGSRMHPLNDDQVVALLVLCAMGVLGASWQELNVGGVTDVVGAWPLLLHVGAPMMLADTLICLLNAVGLRAVRRRAARPRAHPQRSGRRRGDQGPVYAGAQ